MRYEYAETVKCCDRNVTLHDIIEYVGIEHIAAHIRLFSALLGQHVAIELLPIAHPGFGANRLALIQRTKATSP